MLLAMDRFAEKAFAMLHRRLHSLTGWSNWRTSRISLNVGIALWLGRDLKMNLQAASWGHSWWAIMMLLDCWFWHVIHGYISRAEEAWTDPVEMLQRMPFNPGELFRIVFWRTFWFYLGITAVLVDALALTVPFGSLGTVLVSFSLYTIFQWQPPAKSLARRAVEATVKKAQEVAAKVPRPVPVPAPIPVGV